MFGLKPAMSYPSTLEFVDRLQTAIRPALVVAFLPGLAHLILQVPAEVPCVCVLEEALWLDRPWLGPGFPRWKAEWVTRSEDGRIRHMLSKIAKRASAIVVISEEEKEAMRAYLPADKIIVLPHGIDVQYFAPSVQVSESACDIVIVGDMSTSRNGDGIVRFAEALGREVDIRGLRGTARPTLALVGRSPSQEVMALGSEQVRVWGEVGDVRPFYAGSKVVAVPATKGTGVKTAVLQAWASGRPIVATEFAARGLPTIPGQNIMLTDTPEELAVAALALLQDSAQVSKLVRNGLETVRSERDVRMLAGRFVEVCENAAGWEGR